jgi:hypothetical protein
VRIPYERVRPEYDSKQAARDIAAFWVIVGVVIVMAIAGIFLF